MVEIVSMLKTKVQITVVALDGDQFPPFAIVVRTTVDKDSPALGRTKLVNVARNRFIGAGIGRIRNRLGAQRANGHLVVTPARRTAVLPKAIVFGAVDIAAALALHGQKVQLAAQPFGTVVTQVGKLHPAPKSIPSPLFRR